ncbi:MAG: FAD-binding protein [Deltaproteobacteria bacterium]|nr:FAD-binding protein [Deltaproteobacteria bacterium]
MISSQIERQIKDIFGVRALFEEIERACYSYDATGLSALPDGVVFPEDEGEIQDLLRLADARKIPIVPRGAGSGFTGGALPVNGGIILSLERMNRIIDIDEKNMHVKVLPGVVLDAVKREVKNAGLYYPPDPASQEFCTIGGNIAECAGGPSGFKYGVTKDYVLSLRNVLPSGKPLVTGVETVKGVVGYNLTGLIVGSEGTLSVVTGATLKLIPHPEAFSTVLAGFATTEDASLAVNAIIHGGIVPAAIELMDSSAVACVREYGDVELHDHVGCYLLIDLDGSREEVAARMKNLIETLRKGNVIVLDTAGEEEEREKLWSLRRAISPSLLKLNPKKINEDITVPRTKLPAMMRKIKELSDRFHIPIVTFGHAGDGNIHVNIMIDDAVPWQVTAGEEIVREVFTQTVRMGGTISGEHGVGTTKKPYIDIELSKDQIYIMKKIKRLFDPNNILNPHKIFP